MNHTEIDPIRIILIDDHLIFLESLGELLNLTEDVVVVGQGSNGEQAVTLTQQHRPDVVVMDIDMPLVNGVEASERILGSLPDSKILLLTSSENYRQLDAALGLGVSGYLLKSAASEQLILAIRSIHAGGTVIDSAMMRHYTLKGGGQSPLDRLTAREREILPLIAKGFSNQIIAEKLYIAEATVRSNVSRTLTKLGLKNRVQLATLALRENLISLEETAPE